MASWQQTALAREVALGVNGQVVSGHVVSGELEPPVGVGRAGRTVRLADLRLMFQALDTGIILQDREGRILDANAAAAAILGVPRAELVLDPPVAREWRGRGPDGTELTDGERRGEELLRTGVPLVGRTVGIDRPDGSVVWTEMSVFPVADDDAVGEPSGLLIVFRDITKQREAEERSRRLSAILESTPDAIVGMDLDGRVNVWNAGAEAVYGYPASEILGQPVSILAPEDRLEEVSFLLEYVAKGESVRNFETVRRRRDGQLVNVAITVCPIRDGDGRVVGLSCCGRDITDRIRLAEEIERNRRRLEEAERIAALRNVERQAAERASRAKSEFISRMSHELRTPLNAVLGFAQLLEMQAGDEHREAIEQILRAGRHLLDLINEVLDIARIESGRVKLSLEPVELDEVLREAVDLIRPSAARRELEIVLPAQMESGLAVVADRQRLMQVLLNLLSNAVKYNRRAGRIELAVGVGADERVRVSVTDTGPGVDPADFDRIFMPFERLGADQTEIEGSGVGLSLARGLVEAMSGVMGVESEPGRGATFWLELPRARQEPRPPTHHRAPALEPRAVEDLSVLYIDDNLANVRLVERVLQMRPGVKLISAMQGRLGFELAREHQPDLILLDVHLPDLSGGDVLRELKCDPATSGIPVAIVSADATPRVVQKFEQDGAHFYLTKPFNIEELLEMVDAVRRGPREVDRSGSGRSAPDLPTRPRHEPGRVGRSGGNESG
ncbi:MAG: PAS domain S-box protein [Acidimicrobiales bacterium]